jgi:hypothetical protein
VKHTLEDKMITFKQIYDICQKYGARKTKNAVGTYYRTPTPKKCAEEIIKLIEASQPGNSVGKDKALHLINNLIGANIERVVIIFV